MGLQVEHELIAAFRPLVLPARPRTVKYSPVKVSAVTDSDVGKVARQLKRSGIPDVEKRLATLRRRRYSQLGPPGTVIP